MIFKLKMAKSTIPILVLSSSPKFKAQNYVLQKTKKISGDVFLLRRRAALMSSVHLRAV